MKSNSKSVHDASYKTLSDICSAMDELQATATQAYYLALAVQRQVDEILFPGRRLPSLESNSDLEGLFLIEADEQGMTSFLASAVEERANKARQLAVGLLASLVAYRGGMAEAMSCTR